MILGGYYLYLPVCQRQPPKSELKPRHTARILGGQNPKNEKLEIVEEFVEKRTAKIPGRPIFGEMMRRIEKGEVSGILS